MYHPKREREREMLESERELLRLYQRCSERRERRERVNMLLILTFFFSLSTFFLTFHEFFRKKKETNA